MLLILILHIVLLVIWASYQKMAKVYSDQFHTCTGNVSYIMTAIWPSVIFIIFFLFIILQVQLSAFSHMTPPYPRHAHHPPLIPPHLGFGHVSFIVVPEIPSSFPPIILPHLPLVTARLFSFFLLLRNGLF